MAQFTFIGDHVEVETLGFRFRAGKPTEVTDERAITKLRGNSHFVEVFDGVEVVIPPHTDIHGVRAKLDAAGIAYDRRWGLKRLQELLPE